MIKSVVEIVAKAKAEVPTISPAGLMEVLGQSNVVVIDVRDAQELEATGVVPGAINISRGMLEFKADPTTPMHQKELAREKMIVLYCASGGRSALSGKVLIDMGYENVRNLGGIKDWVEAGGEVEPAE
ncbi:rhodanese-like domain-containing protein [Kiloniella sp. EL199]|uniref:rhodanese-like domain-containing protein n=1 Tax=Kiloniella sp. EL199 TaxID=2107581 RepID=UPI000EA24028|nr:rhodanese-like domain-containing protein [Kiloniella sp. EL199]